MSGAPVFVTDKDYVKKHHSSDYSRQLIGVHVGSLPAKKVNVATLITPEIKEWIDEAVKKLTEKESRGAFKRRTGTKDCWE